MDREERLLAYMQDRLNGTDKAAFEAELGRDAALSAEVEAMRAVRREFEEAPVADDPAAGWDRLSAAIDAEPVAPPVAANDPRPPRLTLWQVAAVVTAAVLLWEVAVSPELRTLDPGGLTPVTQEVDGTVLQIVFQDDAAAGEIASLLRDVGGTITSGPSALGLYRVRFANRAAAEAGLAALGDRPELIAVVAAE